MRFTQTLGKLVCLLCLAAVGAYSQGNTPSATTNDASAITSTSAQFNGVLAPGGTGPVAGWFEWGTTTSLGTRTDTQVFSNPSSTITLVATISNLQPHTTYYFRAVLYVPVVGVGNIDATVKSFTTGGDAPPTTTTPTTTPPTTTTTTTTTKVATTTGDATGVTSTTATLNGTLNPGGGAASAWFDWGTSSSFGNRTDVQTIAAGTSTVPVTFSLKNLQPHTVYYFRLDGYRPSDGSAALGDVKTFTTADAPTAPTGPTAPTAVPVTVTTTDATSVTSTSATLNGKITAGGTPLYAWFEYGTTTALGTRTDVQAFPDSATTITLTQTLSRLLPGTTYYFRAIVYKGGGTPTVAGEVLSFTTSAATPGSLTVTTQDVSDVSSASARLLGVINPGGSSSTGWFEWGSTTPLANHTTAQNFTGTDSSNFSFTISSLQPNTQYYFRAVGQNSSGTIHGDVKTFTTTRVPSTAPQKISAVETGQIQSGYLIVTPDATSDAPTVTFTYGIVSQGTVQSQAGIVPTMMATDASLFVEIIPSISRNIGVAVANPGDTANAVTLTLHDENGIMLGSPAIVSVAQRQQVAKFVSEVFGADVISNGFRGSLRMQSGTPFGVAGLRFAGSVFSTLPVAITAGVPGVPTRTLTAGATPNSPAPGTVGSTAAVIIPQFAISGGWASQIAFVNNTKATLTGRIDIFDTNGNPMPVPLNGETRSTFTYSIPVGGTFVLAPRDSNGQSPL